MGRIPATLEIFYDAGVYFYVHTFFLFSLSLFPNHLLQFINLTKILYTSALYYRAIYFPLTMNTTFARIRA